MQIQPSAFQGVNIFSFAPIKKDCPSGTSFTPLCRTIHVLTHSSSKILSEPDIQNGPDSRTQYVTAGRFGYEFLVTQPKWLRSFRGWNQLIDIHSPVLPNSQLDVRITYS